MLTGASAAYLSAQENGTTSEIESPRTQVKNTDTRIELFSQTDHPHTLREGSIQFIVIPYSVLVNDRLGLFIKSLTYKTWGELSAQAGVSRNVELSASAILKEELKTGNDDVYSSSFNYLTVGLKIRVNEFSERKLAASVCMYSQLPDPFDMDFIDFGVAIPLSYQFSKSTLGFMPRIDIGSYRLFSKDPRLVMQGGISAIYRVEVAPTLAAFVEMITMGEFDDLDGIAGYSSSGVTLKLSQFIQVGGSGLIGLFGPTYDYGFQFGTVITL